MEKTGCTKLGGVKYKVELSNFEYVMRQVIIIILLLLCSSKVALGNNKEEVSLDTLGWVVFLDFKQVWLKDVYNIFEKNTPMKEHIKYRAGYLSVRDIVKYAGEKYRNNKCVIFCVTRKEEKHESNE
jgi:hypothetical protein